VESRKKMAGPFDVPGDPDIDRLFSDPAFRELAQRGSPAFIASLPDKAIVWANEGARRGFGTKIEALPGRLAIAGPIAGPAPRLKRLLLGSGEGATALSFLVKHATLVDGREVLVSALLGPPPEAGAGAQAEVAPVHPGGGETAEPISADWPGGSPAAAKSAQQVRAELLKRHPQPTVRFLWQTDEAGRVTSITPPLGEIVGARNADLVGEELARAAERLHLDPSGKLQSAMRAPETWSGIEVAWPIAGAAAVVPVDLGGFPVFDMVRSFRGFRGFGVIHLDRIRDAAPTAPVGPAHPEKPTQSEIIQAPTDAVASEPRAADADVPDAAPPAPMVTAANVVPLRPFATLATAFGLRHSAPESPPVAEEAALSEAGSLSASEHLAFEEIARQVAEDSAPDQPALGASSQPPNPRDDATAVLHRLPVAVLVSRNEAPVYANRALLELTGYDSVEHLQAAGGLAKLFEGAREPAADAGTATVRTRQGELVGVESRLQAVTWEGEPASLVTLRRTNDGPHFAQTESLQLEIQQRDVETRELRAILNRATDGVVILDPEGRILSLNRSAEALFGFQQNEVAGEPFTMLIAPESRRVVEGYVESLKAGGGAKPIGGGREVSGLARQNGTIPMLLTLSRLGEEEPSSKLCAIIRDTSAPRRAEQEAHDAREEAERASAIKSDFLAKVSHEIRTPLNAIIGFAEVIMDERLGPIGTERYKDYLRDIHKSGTHVMSLVNDLLDLSKIEAGKMVLDIKSVDANAVIGECVALMQPQANRERVIMRLALAPRLAQIAADERSLRQIVLNLLSNAVKYNEPGGQVIVSTAMSDTGQAIIRIKDTGIGMSDAELALALEPFRQVATARPVSGTGLGLPLTKALIEANRASFTIRSRKNEGTLIEVRFPPARILAESA
jgi:PAS domain S-box-containing protein